MSGGRLAEVTQGTPQDVLRKTVYFNRRAQAFLKPRVFLIYEDDPFNLAEGDDMGALSDLILSAIRDAQTRAEQVKRERLSEVTGGMDLPGLF